MGIAKLFWPARTSAAAPQVTRIPPRDWLSYTVGERRPIQEGGCSRCRPVCYPLRYGERIPQGLGSMCCR